MLDGLKDFALKRAYGFARAKGVICPGCGNPLVLPKVMPDAGLDAEFRCGCGWSGYLQDAMMTGREEEGLVLERPKKCRVVESELESGMSWLVPAKKGGGFLMVFGAFWLAISLIVTGAFVFGDPVDGDTGEPASAWWGLFFIPFLAIGFGVLYLGLRVRWTEVMVVADETRVRVLKKFFGGVKEKSLEISRMDGVWLSESYKSNEKPVYELLVAGVDGGDLTFGSELKDEDKRWLLGRMRLFLPEGADVDEMDDGGRDGKGGEREVFAVKGLRVEKVGEGFRVVREHLSGKWMITSGFLVSVFCGVFFWHLAQEEGVGSGGWFEMIFKLFDLIPMLMLGVFCVIGLALFFCGFGMLGREDRFVFGKDFFEVEKWKGGVEKSKERYARADLKGVTCKRSGAVNNEERYRVDVKAKGKKVTLCGFVEGDVADDLVAWVEFWLSGGEKPVGYGEAMKVDGAAVAKVASTERVGTRRGSIYRKKKQELSGKAGKWALLFPGVFVLVGAVILFFGVRTAMVAGESKDWPSVEGRVTESRVKTSSDSDGTTYSAKVKYRFEVDGAKYVGDDVSFGSFSSSSRSRAAKVVEKYPAGKPVDVFYRPGDPSENVLEVGMSGGTWILPIVGLVFFVIGAVVFRTMLKSVRKKAAEAKA